MNQEETRIINTKVAYNYTAEREKEFIENNSMNWNAFWFNDTRCNENNTQSYYEPLKIDGTWQNTEILTCLNMTVTIIPQ